MSPYINVHLRVTEIVRTDTIKYLGLTVKSDLSCRYHTDNISHCQYQTFKSLSTSLKQKATVQLPCLPTPWLLLGVALLELTVSQKIEDIQNYGMRVILDKPPQTSNSPLRQQLKWTTLQQRRHNFQVHRCLLNLSPSYFSSKLSKFNHVLQHSQRPKDPYAAA